MEDENNAEVIEYSQTPVNHQQNGDEDGDHRAQKMESRGNSGKGEQSREETDDGRRTQVLRAVETEQDEQEHYKLERVDSQEREHTRQHNHSRLDETEEQQEEQSEFGMDGQENQEKVEEHEEHERNTEEPRVTHTGTKSLENCDGGEDDYTQAGDEWESVKGVFKLFEIEGIVKNDDIGELIRCLNLNPTEAEVADITRELSPRGDGVTWEMFLPKLTELMESAKYQPAAEEDLLAAFCTLDPKLTGLLTVQQIKETLTAFGEPLTDEEFEQFIKFAPKDPQSGMVNYKEYAKDLCAR